MPLCLLKSSHQPTPHFGTAPVDISVGIMHDLVVFDFANRNVPPSTVLDADSIASTIVAISAFNLASGATHRRGDLYACLCPEAPTLLSEGHEEV